MFLDNPASHIWYSQGSGFAEPFADYSAQRMPRHIMDALRWSERIVLGDGVYRSAIERIASYFITDIELTGASREQLRRYEEYLHDHLGLVPILRAISLDILVYGNSFVSVIEPFRRHLICKNQQCHATYPLRHAFDRQEFNVTWQNFEFHMRCPHCGKSGKVDFVDYRSVAQDDVRIKRWSPHEMEILWDAMTDATSYVWRIPPYYANHIRQGHQMQLLHAPKEIIEAVKNNQWFRFDDNRIFHARDYTLAGVLNKGFGISRVFSNFRQAWYLQVLRRYNEAIGMDYILPLRLITPAPRPTAAGEFGDPLLMSDLSNFSSRMEDIIREHRLDPASYHVFPYPVQYQMLGAPATNMAPYELIQLATDDLLTAIGTPVQFYKGTLTLETTQPALRLMESQFSQLIWLLNRSCQWIVRQLCDILQWEKIDARLKKPSHADDISRQMARLQLMTGRLISRGTGLASIGLDYEEEQRRLLEEQKFEAEETQRIQDELQRSGLGSALVSQQLGVGMMGGGPAGPVAGPPAGPSGGEEAAPVGPVNAVDAVIARLESMDTQNMSLPDMQAAVQSLVQQIFALHPTDRIRALRALKLRNQTMHALVKAQLEDLETQVKQQGLQMARQTAQSQAAQPSVPPV